MPKTRIVRLVELISLLQAGPGHTASSLARECGVSRRTIFRDLEILRQAGVPLEFNDDRQRYHVPGAVLLPPTNFTPQEALALLTICQELGNSRGIPLYGAARSAAAKIESSLPSPLRDELREASRAVRIRLGPVNPLAERHDHYDKLLQATQRRKAARITYDSLAEGERIGTKLFPYQLFFNRRSWYVVGRSSLHRAIRTFNIGRICALELLDESFRVPRGFNVDQMLGNAWNLIPEPGPDEHVTVRFDKLVAHNVAEVLWHKTQRLEWRADGTLDFHAQVSGLHEISWWILGYADHARVIRPRRLREIVLERGRKLLDKYATSNGDGEAADA
ncbi:MAG: WYL domain-containing protein [Planctomycetes bacterium]|nr:WYL domain-containing protein [Planctomycetota bacterium]